MLGFGPSETQVLALVFFALFKLTVLAVRLGWWLVFRRPWLLLVAVAFVRATPELRPPGSENLLYLALVIILLWCCICALSAGRDGLRAVRARRLANRALRELERPVVQEWAVSRIGDPTVRAGASGALRIWGGWRRGRREVRRVMHGTDLPRGLRKRWNDHVRQNGGTDPSSVTEVLEGLGFDEPTTPWLDRFAARASADTSSSRGAA